MDSSTLAGSYPSAQLSKASSVGLRDDVDAVQGEALTRQDCVMLFYNLLVSDNSSGTYTAPPWAILSPTARWITPLW